MEEIYWAERRRCNFLEEEERTKRGGGIFLDNARNANQERRVKTLRGGGMKAREEERHSGGSKMTMMITPEKSKRGSEWLAATGIVDFKPREGKKGEMSKQDGAAALVRSEALLDLPIQVACSKVLVELYRMVAPTGDASDYYGVIEQHGADVAMRASGNTLHVNMAARAEMTTTRDTALTLLAEMVRQTPLPWHEFAAQCFADANGTTMCVVYGVHRSND